MILALVTAFSSVAEPNILFQENWESGNIDPKRWRTQAHDNVLLAVEDISGDGSDHALVMWPGLQGPVWSISVRSAREFSRSDEPVVTALLWGDPSRAMAEYAYPLGMGWLFGFHNEEGFKYHRIYEDLEAVMDNWFAPMYGDLNRFFNFTQAPVLSVFNLSTSGKRMSGELTAALGLAVSKEKAIQIRIHLGKEQGAKFEWFNPVTRVWVEEVDTIGVAGGEKEKVTLGFGPANACVFIDDIVVEKGPILLPRAATPTPEGLVLFEDWETGAIDPAKWNIRKANPNVLMSVLDISGDGSDHALAMWIGSTPIHWPIAIRSKLGFKRSSAPQMTALIWGDPTRTDGKYTYPNGTGWLLGFHTAAYSKPWIWDDLEAVLDDWLAVEYGNTHLRFTQPPAKSVFARGEGGPRLTDSLTAALQTATSKDKAIRIRITLGEKMGACLEWQRKGVANWIMEVDTRGRSGGATKDVAIGFGAASASVFIDDITVTGEVSVVFDGLPKDYPRFRLAGHERESKILTDFYWHHFVNRIVAGGYGKTLFNKEYISISDLWAGGAVDGPECKPIQQSFRESLLGIRQDEDGYIHAHQHFSHAHEAGWPFPMWTQVPEGPLGVTVGWHFQVSGPGWTIADLKRLGLKQHLGEGAMEGWELDNIESQGVVDGKWTLRSTGPSPSLTPPLEKGIDAFNCPFLQLRWLRFPEPVEGAQAAVEWIREGDTAFSPDRKITFTYGQGGNPEYESQTGTRHSLVKMYTHPQWEGHIKALRLSLAPHESDVEIKIDSFFTVYDTRHAMDNPIFILASWNYFRWTGDVDFLRQNAQRMRKALAFQRGEMGGAELNFIRNLWPGHDGRPGFDAGPPKVFYNGHGIGDQYCDILPFGGDATESTAQYYASTIAIAEMEEAIRKHPDWKVPLRDTAFDPQMLRTHAGEVKRVANSKFWNADAGRFVASIDADGVPHDYGYTFLNQEAVWLGMANDANARSIMDWISGKRIVEGDTATGDDIYHWRLAPRLSTKRNTEWCGFVWSGPETIPWGFQIQDGGAVLGFSFHDMWTRLQVYGPDNAWQRLMEILDWEEEVWKEGGYRNYYSNHEGTMQGGGPPGGLGIDHEFLETSMVPAIVTLGFLGLDPGADALAIRPSLPSQCPEMTVENVLYHDTLMDVTASNNTIEIRTQHAPRETIRLELEKGWKGKQAKRDRETGLFLIDKPGLYRFVKE